jgi:hypothetical protein
MYKTNNNLNISWESKLKTKADQVPISDYDYQMMICDHKRVEQSKWKVEKCSNMQPKVVVKWCENFHNYNVKNGEIQCCLN